MVFEGTDHFSMVHMAVYGAQVQKRAADVENKWTWNVLMIMKMLRWRWRWRSVDSRSGCWDVVRRDLRHPCSTPSRRRSHRRALSGDSDTTMTDTDVTRGSGQQTHPYDEMSPVVSIWRGGRSSIEECRGPDPVVYQSKGLILDWKTHLQHYHFDAVRHCCHMGTAKCARLG